MPRNPHAKAKPLTDTEYAVLLAQQGGGCAICGNPPKSRRLDNDHDHRTGVTRGLLCHRCNRALPTWIKHRWLLTAFTYMALGRGYARLIRDAPYVGVTLVFGDNAVDAQSSVTLVVEKAA